MKIVACIGLWVLLGMFGCVACVSSLLPVGAALKVAPGREIAAGEVPDYYHPRGSFSRVGGYHPPYQGWAEINAAAAGAEAAVRAAEAARPEPPVTIVNVTVEAPRPRLHYYHHRPGARRQATRVTHAAPAPGPGQPARSAYRDPPPLWPTSR
jgi:hypothetical protein